MGCGLSYVFAMFFGFLAFLFSVISQGITYWTEYGNHMHSGLYESCYNSSESPGWPQEEQEACFDIGKSLY